MPPILLPHGTMVKFLQEQAAFTDYASFSSSLIHLMLNFKGKWCILWRKTAKEVILPFVDVWRSKNKWIINHI